MDDKKEIKITSPFLSEEVTLEKRTPFHAQLAILRFRSWKIFAHHPTCSQYNEHYFTIGKLNLCIGCSMIYSAIILYTILFFAIPMIFRYNYWLLASLPFVGFALAIVHLLLKIKNKWIKAIFRFIAGFGIGAYLALVIETFFIPKRWWLGLILLSVLFLGNQLYGISRGPKANRKKCQNCPLALNEPPCNPEHNTNIKIRKIYAIVDEELEKVRAKIKEPKKT